MVQQDMVGATVAISGGLGGLGRAVAQQVLRRGGEVLLTGRRPAAEVGQDISAVVADSGVSDGRVRYARFCGSDPVEAAQAFAHVPLTGAVVAAGTPDGQPVLEATVEALTESFAVNTIAGFVFAQAAARRMRELGRGGAIVAMSSWVARRPVIGGAAYCASKAALETLMQSMALELAPFNIRANSVGIGIVGEQGMAARDLAGQPEVQAALEKAIPLGRLATPDELGKLVAWLLSPDAGYLSGADIRFDGAASLAPPI